MRQTFLGLVATLTILSIVPSGAQQTVTQILNVNYESGTINSGIPTLTTTAALAPDASYIVSEARSGLYAVAHKVVLDNPAYVSQSAPRSESANNAVPGNMFQLGWKQVCEFSFLLKDWQSWDRTQSSAGDIIWQAKRASGGNPSMYIAAKRNSLVFRSHNNNYQSDLISDVRNQVNQWIDVRIEVKWSPDPDGYVRVMIKNASSQAWQTPCNLSNIITFATDTGAYQGYYKWGLYRPTQTVANGSAAERVIYHDDIRVFNIR